MGKAAKIILDALAAAKVPASMRARAKALIDEAPDWNAAEAAEVEAVVRYVCGAGDLPDALSADFLKDRASALLKGLSTTRALDDWDARALDVLARASSAYWFWEVDAWLDARVVASPGEPVFDEALAMLRARGLWPDDQAVTRSMLGHLSGHLTRDGEVTSTGRWLLAQLDRDPDAVVATARQGKRGMAPLYRLLLAQRRELFERLLPGLRLERDADKSFLAEQLLEADAARYEAHAVALMEALVEPIPAVLSAHNLEKHFAGRYRADVKRLLRVAIEAKATTLVFDGQVTDTRALACGLAWPALGADAIEVWRAYHEDNDALRVAFFATIAAQASAEALPFLLDGLVYPKDPKVEYGGLTHAKYVQRMLALLAPYDLAPYRERIAAAFATNTDRKIRELLAPVLGTPSKTTKAKAKTKAKKAFAGKQGYRFERYVASIVDAALAAAKGAQLPSPIEQVKLGGMPEEVQLNVLLIEGVGDPVELELDVPASKVPLHVDLADEDTVLPAFAKLHGLADGEGPSWGDLYQLPWCVLLHEQIRGAEAIARGLAEQGAVLAPDCRIGVGDYDNFWDSAESFERRSRTEFAALPEAQQADLAAVCFEDPDKQAWLRGS
ncbi:MAG: hypothetical protein R2939_02630 [Kofleriaceae bacterium]